MALPAAGRFRARDDAGAVAAGNGHDGAGAGGGAGGGGGGKGDEAPRAASRPFGRSLLALVPVAIVVLVAIAFLAHIVLGSSTPAVASGALLTPDQPPLEFVYLDADRVDNYLGQVEDGLSPSELRSAQSTRSISAGLTGGSLAQVGASLSQQQGIQDTVTTNAADRFYLLLQLLRQEQGSRCLGAASHGSICIRQTRDCGAGDARPHWLTDISDTWGTAPLSEIQCLGVGYFIRLTGVQLFLPPFAQVLPNAQSATALYGGDPWPRTAFTSPTQSLRSAQLSGYVRSVLRATHGGPRIPLVAAPYGGVGRIGTTAHQGSVPILLPADYASLTTEPSLLSGSVTVVGKIVYFAPAGGPSYVDYPTISEFTPILAGTHELSFGNQIGVCDTNPPGAVLRTTASTKGLPGETKASRTGAKHGGVRHGVSRATAPAAPAFAPNTCRNAAAVRTAVKRSVTLKPPFAVVLPLAIYQ